MTDLISQDRLTSYVSILKTKDDESLRAYYWNKSLASSIYPALQCLEITLRNSIDISIKNNPPSGGLYMVGDWWFEKISKYLGDKLIRRRERYSGTRIIKTIWEEQQVSKILNRFNKKHIPITSSKVLAGLDFGFWTNFLSDKFEDTGSNTLLWPNLFSHVFPNAPSGTTRQEVEKKFNRVREFRNRISHHEPIWKFYYSLPADAGPDYTKPVYGRAASINLLKKQFEEIIELIGWIDKDTADYLLNSRICASFNRICSMEGFNSYVFPERSKVIDLNKNHKIKKLVNLISRGIIFNITRKNKVIATIGADLPIKE